MGNFDMLNSYGAKAQIAEMPGMAHDYTLLTAVNSIDGKLEMVFGFQEA